MRGLDACVSRLTLERTSRTTRTPHSRPASSGARFSHRELRYVCSLLRAQLARRMHGPPLRRLNGWRTGMTVDE